MNIQLFSICLCSIWNQRTDLDQIQEVMMEYWSKGMIGVASVKQKELMKNCCQLLNGVEKTQVVVIVILNSEFIVKLCVCIL